MRTVAAVEMRTVYCKRLDETKVELAWGVGASK